MSLSELHRASSSWQEADAVCGAYSIRGIVIGDMTLELELLSGDGLPFDESPHALYMISPAMMNPASALIPDPGALDQINGLWIFRYGFPIVRGFPQPMWHATEAVCKASSRQSRHVHMSQELYLFFPLVILRAIGLPSSVMMSELSEVSI